MNRLSVFWGFLVSAIISTNVLALDVYSLAIEGYPASTTVTMSGQYTRQSSATVVEFKDGSMGILVKLNYGRGWPSDGHEFVAAGFFLSEGSLVREDSEVYWVKGKTKIPVAHRKWGYSQWVLNEGVKIKRKIEKVDSEHAWDQYRVSITLHL